MINIVKRYLEKSNYTYQKDDFESYFLSHPNYPSVFAITDSLDSLSIPNVAIKVPKEQFVELPESFLAIVNQDMVLVQKRDSYVKIEFENGKKRKLSFNEFLTDWDQVVIAVEPNEVIDIKKDRFTVKGIGYSLPVLVLILLSLIYNDYNAGSMMLLATSLVGLIAGVLILQEKFGYANAMVSKICAITPKTSCNSVITSDYGKKGIPFSDLPFLFFGISVMAIAIQPKDSAIIVGFLSVFSLPILLYSVWIQKVELKRWCVLCLAVSFIVVVQVLIFGLETESFPAVFSIQFFEFLFSVFFFTSTWLLVKPVFEAKSSSDKEVLQAIKFKRNYALFNFLTKDVPSKRGFNQLEGLFFGNKNADVKLTVIISPSCGHCHTVFAEAFNLVTKFPERVFLNVLFNINTENNDNPYKVVVEQLMAIHNSFPEKTVEAVSDWHIRNMELDQWRAKWASNIVDMKTSHQIRQQYNWSQKNGFNYTPVKIINGRMFPEGYEITDLKYFLNDFSEEREAVGSGRLAQA
ncbi:hypothetical protein FLJC2902T_01710 [Flavobacterium limnosediminis JC2902]|uniref:Vitamin K epoxide reductase domain-containing protein n=1 Tax=Flavobacterium limnosediminis JC2902 TaxID=1341181 RepID=V6SSN0_9FLAO|nr:vitamin K epoxide reductase family protein [Flavobacterium limnosediminis]ESU29698.1 hypothetical protein FLJC2902T_01710 [Flavobacterium limnosediminis JC2902]